MVAKSADEARAQAASKSSQQAAAKKAADAKAAAARTAAAQAAAKKAADKAAADKKESNYINSLTNPITSQYDPRIAQGGRVTAGGSISLPNPEMATTQMTSSGVAPKIFPEAGKLLRYRISRAGYRVPVLTDGKGGEVDGNEEIDPDYKAPLIGGGIPDVPKGPVLASDIFKQTLAIFFGASEIAKPWANELYNVVSKFYKQGATSEEAFNMAVLDSEKNPALTDFTKRFKGIYALQKMKQAGKAVTVPTIAEYFATESKMGDVLKQSSLGELANEDFLGDVLGKGVSATEFANRITAIFDRIDNSPKEIKDTLSRFFPSVDRISLAKAIALGDKGAKELQAQVAGYEILSAAEKQGLDVGKLTGGVTEERAYQYALGGETYDTALTKFGTVAAGLPTVNKLTEIYGEPTLGQAGLESAIFGKSAKEIKALEDLAKREEASFSGRSGLAPTALASQRRGAGLI